MSTARTAADTMRRLRELGAKFRLTSAGEAVIVWEGRRVPPPLPLDLAGAFRDHQDEIAQLLHSEAKTSEAMREARLRRLTFRPVD